MMINTQSLAHTWKWVSIIFQREPCLGEGDAICKKIPIESFVTLINVPFREPIICWVCRVKCLVDSVGLFLLLRKRICRVGPFSLTPFTLKCANGHMPWKPIKFDQHTVTVVYKLPHCSSIIWARHSDDETGSNLGSGVFLFWAGFWIQCWHAFLFNLTFCLHG